MKALCRSIGIAGGILVLAGAQNAVAQITNSVEFTTSFPFTVGNTTVPAGSYTIRPDDDDPNILALTGARADVLFQTENKVQESLPSKTEVTFNRYGDGYVHGGGPAKAFARAAEKACAAWADGGRPGMPRLCGQGYFAVGGEDAIARGVHSLKSYYAFLGPFSERIVAGLLTTPHALAQYARSYADAGCDELLLVPTVPDLDQLERLADVVTNVGLTGDAARAAL